MYAGGNFVGGVARWDTAANTWSTLGTGVSGEVKALAVNGSNLYVGGWFEKAGEQPSGGLAGMNSDGSLDSAFSQNASFALGPYTCTAVLPDGGNPRRWATRAIQPQRSEALRCEWCH